jgi:hypothetical protein
MDSTTSPKMKTTEGEGVGVHSLVHNTSGVEGCAKAPKWGLGRLKAINYSHELTQIKQQVG